MNERREDSIANNAANESEELNREGSSGQSTASLNDQEHSESGREEERNSTSDNEGNNTQGISEPNENDDQDRSDVNIFDRFMDSILSYRNRVLTPGTGGSDGATSSTTASNSVANPEVESATEVGLTTGTAEGNALNTSTDSNGAIVITVNYVFSDENNPQNPNRSGSLVMTLPNNSSNRYPRIIQEFIRLATLMAYSTIVNLNKEKGITIDKFNSFDIKTLEELKDTSRECSICFEDYIAFSDKNGAKKRTIADEIKSDDASVKRRKLNNNEAESVAPLSSSTTSPNSSTGEANSSRPKYLSEFTGTFEHLPVQMPCGHIFGKSCLFEWLKSHSSCPLCRDSVSDSNNNEATSTEGNNENPNSNITFIHRPGIIDIFNSFPRSGEGNQPVRRILRSGNGLGEGNNPRPAHTHTHFMPSAGGDSNEDPSTNQRGVFSHLLNYLRRSQLGENTEPLFPTGVSSTRNAHGVETRLTDRNDLNDNVLEFLNLRSLVDENNGHANNDTSNLANRNDANSNADDNSNDTNTNNTNNNDNENATE